MALFPNFGRFKKEVQAAEEIQKLAKAAKDARQASSGERGRLWSSIVKKLGTYGPMVDKLLHRGGQLDPKAERELGRVIDAIAKSLEEEASKTAQEIVGRAAEILNPEPVEEEQAKAVNLFEGMIPVSSSNVHSIGYKWDDERQRSGDLYVRFLGGDSKHRAGPGPMYKYHAVPREVFVAMKLAASKGGFVWDELRIRGTVAGHQYEYDLVGAGEEGYIPRQAVVAKRGRAGRGAFVRRTLNGQRSQLPDREIRGSRAITKDFRGEATRIRMERGKRP